MSTPACSHRIFTGARWDIAGHPCSLKPSVQDEQGNWWCKRHSPDGKAAAAEKRRAAARAAADARNAARDEVEALLDALGLRGYPSRSVGRKFDDPVDGAFIRTEALREAVARLQRPA